MESSPQQALTGQCTFTGALASSLFGINHELCYRRNTTAFGVCGDIFPMSWREEGRDHLLRCEEQAATLRWELPDTGSVSTPLSWLSGSTVR